MPKWRYDADVSEREKKNNMEEKNEIIQAI